MSADQNSEDTRNISRREFLKKGKAVFKPVEAMQKAPGKRVLGRNTAMTRRNFIKLSAGVAAVVGLVAVTAGSVPKLMTDSKGKDNSLTYKGKVTNLDRQAAAQARVLPAVIQPMVAAVPGGTPDYFGTTPNYANSPLPTVTNGAGTTTALTGFNVVSGGSGYTTPAVILTGGGGSGATATARVSNGVILGLVLVSAGTGYTSAPTVSIRDPSPKAQDAAATTIITG
jgi:hypothetical protein